MQTFLIAEPIETLGFSPDNEIVVARPGCMRRTSSKTGSIAIK
jgi:hypothetical protein